MVATTSAVSSRSDALPPTAQELNAGAAAEAVSHVLAIKCFSIHSAYFTRVSTIAGSLGGGGGEATLRS